MKRTFFRISQMDCPSEEQMIRLKLQNLTNISSLQFDIPNRKLTVYHTDDYEIIFNQLKTLNLGAAWVETTESEFSAVSETNVAETNLMERKLLFQVLGINFFFFLLELSAGYLSKSMGLVADSLDMLADSIVYGLALYAVGGHLARKKNIAKASGYFQFSLAVLGIIEVIRRFSGFENTPDYQTMILISFLALIGNGTCLYLINKSRSKEAHMRASMIFTSNDVIVNIGVMLAGALVYFTGSKYPDLIVGSLVFILVCHGAIRILKLAK